jgi:hypothetical protein
MLQTATPSLPEFAISRRPRRRPGRIIGTILVLGIGLFWIVQTVRRGMFSPDPSGVTMVTSTTPARGDAEVLPNTFVTAYFNPGHSIDRGTLDNATVRLYRTGDRMPVAATVSTSAACDDIVLTPTQMLEPRTQYTFEVDGVKHSTGAEMLPFKMTFTTSGGT